MAVIDDVLTRLLTLEGGYVLTNTKGDLGGLTYAGVSRIHNPNWPGWKLIDAGDLTSPELKQYVAECYKQNYWMPLRLDEVGAQSVADAMFICGVHSGVNTAARLVQVVIGAKKDGKVGPQTLAELNQYNPELFVARFTIAQIARYVKIVDNKPDQKIFLKGWINRVLKHN